MFFYFHLDLESLEERGLSHTLLSWIEWYVRKVLVEKLRSIGPALLITVCEILNHFLWGFISSSMKSTYMVFSTSSYFTFKVSWTPTSYATNCLKDFKFYMYQVEFIILSKDPDPLLGLISVNSFPVVNTRYLSIYHVSSLTHPPPFHPVNSNSHASLKSSFLTSIASASLEHLLPSLI